MFNLIQFVLYSGQHQLHQSQGEVKTQTRKQEREGELGDLST